MTVHNQFIKCLYEGTEQYRTIDEFVKIANKEGASRLSDHLYLRTWCAMAYKWKFAPVFTRGTNLLNTRVGGA